MPIQCCRQNFAVIFKRLQGSRYYKFTYTKIETYITISITFQTFATTLFRGL